MDVMPLGGVQAAPFLWRLRGGAWALTVIAKVTFQLRPGTSLLADTQEPVVPHDEHWDDDPARSVFAPADLVPFKALADIVLVGDAFAPRGEPVRSLVTRLQVGTVDKAIEVVCDRAWTREGQLRDGKCFARMPLVYERAAGGPGTRNPAGVHYEGAPDRYGKRPVPNLQPIDFTLHAPSDAVPPIGFGPIAPSWPERRDRLGALATRWPIAGWNDHSMPDGLDPRYFNVAPSDQQVDALRPDERIILEHLHLEHPRLVTSLPGVFPRARIGRPGKPTESLDLRADTLWIDTNRGICTVTWRAQVQLASRDEPGLITVDVPGMAAAAPEQEADDDAVQTIVPFTQHHAPAMPFAPAPPGAMLGVPASVAQGPPPSRPAATSEVEAVGTLVLPPDAAVELSDADVEDARSDETLPPGQGLRRSAALPFQAPPSAPAAVAPATAPVESPRVVPPPPPPPPFVRPPMAADPSPAPPAATPWAPPAVRASSPTVGQSAAAPSPVAPASAGRVAERGGVFVASNAAAQADAPVGRPQIAPATAEPKKKEEPKPQRPREILKLLWFDPKALPAIRRHDPWRVTLAELELRLLEEGIEDEEQEASNDGAPAAKDRRDVFEILARAQPASAEGVRLAVDEAIDEEGRFEPPLVLVAGDLELPFDELETLKATVTAVNPFAATDKKLKETLDTVAELLKTPWLQGSGGVAESMTRKLQDAFAQGQPRLGADYLQTHTDRMLLEERRYQKRTVYEGTWIRSLLHLGGAPIPTYLPEALGKALPMFKRFRVKLIGEVDLREDQYESHPHAVRAVAVARVVER